MIAHVIVDTLGLDADNAREIKPHDPLLGDHLDRNGFAAMELGARIKEEFDVSIFGGNGSQNALKSIASLASFIRRQAPISVVASLPELDAEFDETQQL
jgi:acyl carrier protein